MSYSEKIQHQHIWNLIGGAVMQSGLVCVFLHFSVSSFHSSLFPFLCRCPKKMHVCPAATHHSCRLSYLHIVNNTSRRANRWQDGKREEENHGSPQSPVWPGRQIGNGSWREGIWRSCYMCLSLLIVFTETQHMQRTCTLWHLFLHQLKWVQTCRQMERKGSVCIPLR